MQLLTLVYNSSEVNLKIKQALPETAKYTSPQHISQLGGVIKSEQPNNRLYNYDGTFSIPSKELAGKTKDHPVDPTQVLLRGAQLRNTSWIYGIVVFTGHETKLMLNSRYFCRSNLHEDKRHCAKNELLFPCHSKKPTKQSNVTRMTNKNILSLFIILVLMSIACAAGNFVISVSPFVVQVKTVL
jgi:phospholipid-transporting ATPase